MGGLAKGWRDWRAWRSRRLRHICIPMRRWAYISILISLWLFGMAGLMLGMDSLLHPPFFPHALFAGGSFAAFATGSLAEEVAERIRGNRAAQLPCRWEGWC
jgi:hypothetical protein